MKTEKYIQFIVTALIAVLAIISVVYRNEECQFKWSDTGYEVKYSYKLGTCLAQQANGKWFSIEKMVLSNDAPIQR